MFARITSDKHAPLKNLGGHGTMHFLGHNKGRDVHPQSYVLLLMLQAHAPTTRSETRVAQTKTVYCVNACPQSCACAMIISQPSSRGSPWGCGGTENSEVLKISTTENEALSTIYCFFSGPRAAFHELKIERMTTCSHVFWDHLQIFSN